MNIDEIKNLAAKIADLWRSESVENHALGLMFLQSQTNSDPFYIKHLLKYIVYNCINTDEFRACLFFRVAGRRIKEHFLRATEFLKSRKTFHIFEWVGAIRAVCSNCVLIKLGGFLQFQIKVQMGTKFYDYINEYSKKAEAYSFPIEIERLDVWERSFLNDLHIERNYRIKIEQNLPYNFNRPCVEAVFCDSQFLCMPAHEIFNLVIDCFIDNYESGKFTDLFDSFSK